MKICHQCARENLDQTFCGECGSPLDLKDYITTRIKEQLDSKDRNATETDIAIKVFERVFGWMKILATIFSVLLVIVGLLGIWKGSDFWSGVNLAKQTAVDSSTSAASEINRSMNKMRDEVKTFDTDLASSRKQLQEAKTIQPQVNEIQGKLRQAVSDIDEQKRVLSSSEEFVKSVFSTYRMEIFTVGEEPKTRLAILEPTGSIKLSHVAVLLKATPIRGTLRVQIGLNVLPSYGYWEFRNLLLFNVPEPDGQQLSVFYFPDPKEQQLIKSLAEHDGRLFADDEPLPAYGEPNFNRNSWFEIKDGQLSLKTHKSN